MKRFWDVAATEPDAEGWRVLLDGRPLRVPGGGPLLLPGHALAEAVAAEWQAAGEAKGGEMTYADVPLTRLAGTAQERIAPDPEPVILELSRYAESDLLCYRAEWPPELARKQDEMWQPWLDWSERTHGAKLRSTVGIVHVPQEPQALATLARATAALAPAALAALGIAVPALGSLVLGLAMAAFRLDATEAHVLATLDEAHQARQWGDDDEAVARRARMRDELAIAARFLHLAGSAGAVA